MRTKLNLALILLLAAVTPLAIAQGQQNAKLNVTTFVVLGEGLAAGMANYALTDLVQDKSFPAQMARQMKTAFPQPLMQGPSIGDVLGCQTLPVRVPTYPQGQVRILPAKANRNDEAPTLFVFNLSVPGMKLAESLSRWPNSPLIQRDMPQTAVNLILGFPSLILNDDVPVWTQFEYAKAMLPTFALIELGYYEALEAAVNGDPARIPDAAAFRTNYAQIVKGLRDLQAQVVVTTIPDPIDTAYFTPVAAAASFLRTSAFTLLAGYDLRPEDYVTREGLRVIGNQFLRRKIEPLPADAVMRASVAAAIRSRVRALNDAINSIAKESGAVVYDLQGFFSRVRSTGVKAGNTTLTGEYYGGFYSLDGYYPGTTGHALIANDILGLLNRTYQRSFAAVDLAPILQTDASVQYRPASGRLLTAAEVGIGGGEEIDQ